MKPHINLAALAPLDGVESATSAWVAFECEMIVGQELSVLEEQMHADLVTSAKVNELEAWGKFKVPPRLAPAVCPKIRLTLVGCSPGSWWMDRKRLRLV